MAVLVACRRNYCSHANPVRIASSLRADMIFGRDTGRSNALPVTAFPPGWRMTQRVPVLRGGASQFTVSEAHNRKKNISQVREDQSCTASVGESCCNSQALERLQQGQVEWQPFSPQVRCLLTPRELPCTGCA